MEIDRVAFTYSTHGAGVLEARFVVLCSFGTPFWEECFDFEQRREFSDYNPASAWKGPRGMWTSRTAHITLVGDTVVARRTFTWALILEDESRGATHTRDLGTSRFTLP